MGACPQWVGSAQVSIVFTGRMKMWTYFLTTKCFETASHLDEETDTSVGAAPSASVGNDDQPLRGRTRLVEKPSWEQRPSGSGI